MRHFKCHDHLALHLSFHTAHELAVTPKFTFRSDYIRGMIQKPDGPNGWLDNYIHKVDTDNLLEGLKKQTQETLELCASLSDELADYRYAEGKWSVRDILLHLIDAERVFAYRALRFSRNDKTELPGFDEGLWVEHAHASERSMKSLLEEYIVTRTATVALFSNFTQEMLAMRGKANGVEMSVAALGFGILGHEVHHVTIIRERYLNK